MIDFKESEDNASACRQIEHDSTTETVEVCPYCWKERGNRLHCCGEVHFTEMSRKAWNGEEE